MKAKKQLLKTDYRKDPLIANQRGVAAIIVALTIMALLGVAALAVDIGYRNVAKNEIQNIADASALAGAGELGRQYLDINFIAVDESLIVSIAENVASKNADGFSVVVEIGTWIDRETGFDATAVNRPNAVRVIARRSNDENSPIPTFFARIWNIFGLDAQADAVAALTGSGEVDEGDVELPVGISKDWFTDDFCGKNITFYPTSGMDGCAGWHAYAYDKNGDGSLDNANASLLNDILLGLGDGTFVSPGIDLNENPESAFAFIGGNLSNLDDAIKALYNSKKDADGIWRTSVAIYDAPCGSNPNEAIKIVGFASVEVGNVIGPPVEMIATLKCEMVSGGIGGGNYYGTWGSIPGLVE